MTQAPHSLPRSLQDLPPSWAHFCLKIERFITGDLEISMSGKTLVTAFSGGVDSTALLLVLHCLSRKNNGRVVAVHLNHNLRDEADADARWAESFCQSLGVDSVIRSVDVGELARQEGIGIEEAGRNARYDLFAEVMESRQGDYLAVGHHLDDLAEDVLMRLSRGTGWPGLAGMPGHDPARGLIRPFLLTPKKTLTQFLTDLDIPWREDATNQDENWTRNRIRHGLLPLFLEENPNFLESVARLWKIGALDADYWDSELRHINNLVPADVLENAHKAKRLRLYKTALDNVGNGGQALADTLFKLDDAWSEKRVNATFQFPGGRTATITPSGVLFSAKH
jgi:tRNA(Ile)-lysidine synthase